MRSVLRFTLALAAALGAAVVLFVAFTLPPATVVLSGPLPPTVAFGAYHVHTAASDGSGTRADVAAAAARAGLQFVLITDHGDGTRPPDPPAYLDDVLVIDAVEVGSDDGHVVAIGLTRPAPYPLGGRAVDVIEDIHRLGGWAVAAHPDSPKPGLQWRAAAAPYDAVEWINADSEWRDEPPSRLAATFARSLVRGPEAIASLFGPPTRSFRRWDTAARTRPVAGLAAVDAHARLLGFDEDGVTRDRTWLARPTYEQMFRTLVQAVILDAPPGGDAAVDAASVIAALRGGRTFSVIRARAWPASLEFSAQAGSMALIAGGRLPAGIDTTIRARVPDAPEATLTLVTNGVALASGQGSLTWTGPVDAGVYRVEAARPGSPMPWIVSSPIYAGDPLDEAPPDAAPASGALVLLGPDAAWNIEQEARSSGRAAVVEGELRFDFSLGPGVPSGQYAALTTSVGGDTGFDRIQFMARASRPMRLSVQARLPPGDDGQRWRRSVYVDETPRLIVVPLEDLQPVDAGTTQRPVVAHVRGLLFVVDTVNTAPGASGTIWLKDVALGIGSAGGGG